MRHVLNTILTVTSLTLACGDDGRGSGSATAVSTSLTGITSLVTEGASSTGGGTGTTGDDPTSGGSASASEASASSTGTDATSTGPVDPSTTTTGPGTTTTAPGTTTLPDTTGMDPPPCETVLKATIRDFKVDHPDFEDFTNDIAYTGIVQTDLGPDSKPVYAHPGPTAQTSGPAQFAQWYSDVANVNLAFAIDIPLTEVMPGQFTYQNNAFFPIDGQGWGNEGNGNNFHFTTEIHTEFTYQGGEVFTFTGDDDLWLFINGKLAIDLGGTHPQLTETIDLDANAGYFGIQLGGTYPMDIFHAERHTDQSNFRIDTSIQCFIIPG
jgi:fibro-slime domain-containing protein